MFWSQPCLPSCVCALFCTPFLLVARTLQFFFIMLDIGIMSFGDPSSLTMLLSLTSTSFMDPCTILGIVLMGSWYHLVCLLHHQQALQRKVHALISGWGTLFVRVDRVVTLWSWFCWRLFSLQLHMFVNFGHSTTLCLILFSHSLYVRYFVNGYLIRPCC